MSAANSAEGVIIVGLTGGIASGKSTVLTELKEAGAYIIDADLVGHKAYLPGTECLKKLVNHFGKGILSDDGTVNRKNLGAIIFADVAQRQALNDIVWPEIRALIKEETESVSREMSGRSREPEDTPYFNNLIIVEAAILLEAGWSDLVNEVWVVSAQKSVQVDRLMERNGISKSEANKRVSAQMSNEEREKVAHVVIRNDSTVSKLITIVKEELKNLKMRWNKHPSAM